MKRTPSQAGPFAAWLKRRRTARYARQVDAIEDMRRLAGIAISPSEFAQWESGSRVPREDNPKRQRLIEFFGGWPEEPDQAETGERDGPVSAYLAALTAAMTDQTRAITALLDQFRESMETTEARLVAVEAELQSLRARPGVGAQ